MNSGQVDAQALITQPGRGSVKVMVIDDTLNFLCGSWQIEREIDDELTGARSQFIGVADIVPVEIPPPSSVIASALYLEHGTLTVGTHKGPAARRLEMHRNSSDGVDLFFQDGRLFVELNLRVGHWESSHQCANDCYRMATTVQSSELLEERWFVTGPAKRYRAATIMKRLAPSEMERA